MVFNATYNNILVISWAWQSLLLVGGGGGGKPEYLSLNTVRTHNFSGDRHRLYNYHTITTTTTTAPNVMQVVICTIS